MEARHILNKYGRNTNPGSIHKILESKYFHRLGTNVRSPYVPSSNGWEIVKMYLNMSVENETFGERWKRYNVQDESLKPYKDRYLLVDIVLDSFKNNTQYKEESKEVQQGLDDNSDWKIEENDEIDDFVEYIKVGIKYKEMGLLSDAYKMFEKASESNEIIMKLYNEKSLILSGEGLYTDALKEREKYWDNFEESYMHEKRELIRHLNG